jgi:hypothetical protein
MVVAGAVALALALRIAFVVLAASWGAMVAVD